MNKRVSGVKQRFNDIKDSSIADEDDDWIEMRLKEDYDEYEP